MIHVVHFEIGGIRYKWKEYITSYVLITNLPERRIN